MMEIRFTLLLLVLLLVGCNSKQDEAVPIDDTSTQDLSYLTHAPASKRTWLTLNHLQQGEYSQPSPIHNSYFMPIDAELTTLDNFSGNLTMKETKMLGNGPEEDNRGKGYLFFPGFTTDFYTQGEHFVPVKQDIIYSTGYDSFWGIILSPGKIWSEADDQGWLRVAFPFVLTDKLRSQTHNGIATFLFDPTNNEVSKFRFQVVQQTASYFQYHFWGQLDLLFNNESSEDFIAHKAMFNQYLAALPNIATWQSLTAAVEEDYVNAIVSDPNGADYSAIGLHYNDTLYLQACPTPYGDFPFCAQMRQGSFSAAKSMGAGMLLMWLTQKYGEEILDDVVTKYLPIEADHNQWDQVTIQHLINMSSSIGELGIYPENDMFSDEYNEKTGPWTWATSAQEKLDISNSYSYYSWNPGEVFRYRTVDTFTLAAVMDALIKQKEGNDVNLWDRFTVEVLNPIGITVLPAIHTIETNGTRGIPLLGTGLFPTAIDTVLISKLLQNKGVHNGVTLLNTSVTERALEASTMHSLPTFNDDSIQNDNINYRFSFWLIRGTNMDCEYWIPRMAGYGGNFINLLPNGVTFFVYQDAFNSDFLVGAEKIANSLSPMCP